MERSRAALEAALDAAGLLDAWLSPDATGLDGNDSWLDPTPLIAQTPDVAATLRSVLVATPPPDSKLPTEAVEAVLDSVALGAVGIAVDVSGRFALGPLSGRAGKDEAGYIGATARAARRARRLATLDDEIATFQVELDQVRSEVARLAGELRRVDEAPANLPSTAPLLEKLAEAQTAHANATPGPPPLRSTTAAWRWPRRRKAPSWRRGPRRPPSDWRSANASWLLPRKRRWHCAPAPTP